MEDRRFAVLIDSDNVSAKYLPGILDEMTKYGICTYRRIYGDFTSTQATKWKMGLLENSVTPIQQYSNTVGKNATDSTLIIDAMDILYTRNVEGFCIVSSDGDFTRLASRLRESGMMVIGMGEDKTPLSFRRACNVFTTLENLIDQEESELENENIDVCAGRNAENKNGKCQEIISTVIDRSTIENTIVSIIAENENKERITGLGEIGSRLVNKYPDFDVRNYGYSLLSKFLEESDNLEVRKQGNTIHVAIKDKKQSKDEILMSIRQSVEESGKKGIGISELSNSVRRKYPNFDTKDFGYSQFSKLVQSIPGLELYEDGVKRKRARTAQ